MNNDKIKKILEFVRKESTQTHLFLLDILEADEETFNIIKDMVSLKEKEREWIIEVIEQEVETETIKGRKAIRMQLQQK